MGPLEAFTHFTHKIVIVPSLLLTLFIEKNKRLKQAKEEAGIEIEAYRQEREAQFNAKKKNYDGSKDDFEQKMEVEKKEKLKTIDKDIAASKSQVIDRLLSMVYDIKPELHRNKRVE